MVTGVHTVENNVVLGQPSPVILFGAMRLRWCSSFRLCDQDSGQAVVKTVQLLQCLPQQTAIWQLVQLHAFVCPNIQLDDCCISFTG